MFLLSIVVTFRLALRSLDFNIAFREELDFRKRDAIARQSFLEYRQQVTVKDFVS